MRDAIAARPRNQQTRTHGPSQHKKKVLFQAAGLPSCPGGLFNGCSSRSPAGAKENRWSKLRRSLWPHSAATATQRLLEGTGNFHCNVMLAAGRPLFLCNLRSHRLQPEISLKLPNSFWLKWKQTWPEKNPHSRGRAGKRPGLRKGLLSVPA